MSALLPRPIGGGRGEGTAAGGTGSLTLLALLALTVLVATGWYFLVAQISGNGVAAVLVAAVFARNSDHATASDCGAASSKANR